MLHMQNSYLQLHDEKCRGENDLGDNDPEVCCKDHMADEEVWLLLDGLRRDVNRKSKDELVEKGLKVEVVEWWRLLGRNEDVTVTEKRKAGVAGW